MVEENNDSFVRPEVEFSYRGPLGFTLFWFIWSLVGYFYMVFFSTSSSTLEWFYLLMIVLSVMALNNRKYGINHTIRFYSDYLIAPRLLNSWFWQEEKISYKEIDEIDYLDYGDGTTKNLCEITLKTKMFTYPIFGKKLTRDEFIEIHTILKSKTKMRIPDLPEFEEDYGINADKNSNQKEVTGTLALVALVVSGLTIIGISISSPYSDIMNGEKIFFASFLLSFSLIVALIFFIKKKLLNTGEGRLGWKRIFLIGYIWFYGGVATTFGLIFLNGKFSSPDTYEIPLVVTNTLVRESRKGSCVSLSKLPDGRSPSSDVSTKGNLINVCNEAFNNATVGDSFLIKFKNGFFNEGWISGMVKKK